MALRNAFFLLMCMGATAGLMGCGGSGSGSTTPVPPVSIQFSGTPPTSMVTNASAALTAATENGPSNSQVAWSVSCGTANACGSFSPATTASGAATTYTAPGTIPAGGTVTVTATSVADSSKSVSREIILTLSSTSQIAVTFAGAVPAMLERNATAQLSANVANDPSSNPQVAWNVTCGSVSATDLPCGSISPLVTASGAATTYTAPAAVPMGSAVTITATSVTNPAKSVSATILIANPIVVTSVTLVPSTVQVNYTVRFAAVATNDSSADPEIEWTMTCGSSDCGSFSSTTTLSGATTNYTAPAAIPAGNVVTVTATSVTDPTKSDSAALTIVPIAPTLANGTYVFQILPQSGETITGVFTARYGLVTGGEQDENYLCCTDPDPGSYMSPTATELITGGTYSVSSDGTFSITIGTSDFSETMFGTLAANGNGLVAGIDGIPANGTLLPQTSIAAPLGGYAVSVSGVDMYYDAAWVSGVVNIDSPGGISGAGSSLNTTDQDTAVLGGYEIHGLQASTVSAPDSFGRVLFQLNPDSSSSMPPFYLAGYIADATHIFLLETNDQMNATNFQGLLAGVAIAQGSSTGKFTASSIAGASFVFGASGSDSKWGTLNVAGVMTLSSNNTVSGFLNWNDLDLSTAQSPIAFTGSYTVEPTGIVHLSNLTDGSTFTYDMNLILTGDGGALLSGTDTNNPQEVTFLGQVFRQQTAAFSAASFAGSYGLNDGDAGVLTATPGNSADSVTGYLDATYAGSWYHDALTGTFAPGSNGIFDGNMVTTAGLGTLTDVYCLYLVDNTQGILIETDAGPKNMARLQLLK